MDKQAKQVLITGSEGQLGRSIKKIEKKFPQFDFKYTDIDKLDLCNTNQVQEFFSSEQFDIIINCSAYTAVDLAEEEKEKAFCLNALAPGLLADLCKENEMTLIHVSTDFIFDGKKETPYGEDDPANPVSIYGKSKLKGEKNILDSGCNAFIVRTSWLYSEFGKNFPRTIISRAREGKALKVVNDQFGRPTYATDLANFILNIAGQAKPNGAETLHYSNSGSCSWYEFASEIITQLEISSDLTPCNSDEFIVKAKRPKYSVLSLEKIKSKFGLSPRNWQSALSDYLSYLQ